MARTSTTTLSIGDVITDVAADVNEPHSHISTYCPRHYVATMFHILEVEAPLNGDEFDVLVSKHGPIAEWG